MIKIAITGPESSGKSTLTEQLANYFNAPFFLEYARDYLLNKKSDYTREDLTNIALQQEELRNHSHQDQPLLIYDTENLVIYIWSKVKYGKVDSKIQALLEQQYFTHYFLCRPDIPWEFDELRENPTDREQLFELYRQELDQRALSYSIIEGNSVERLTHAISTVQLIINQEAQK